VRKGVQSGASDGGKGGGAPGTTKGTVKGKAQALRKKKTQRRKTRGRQKGETTPFILTQKRGKKTEGKKRLGGSQMTQKKGGEISGGGQKKIPGKEKVVLRLVLGIMCPVVKAAVTGSQHQRQTAKTTGPVKRECPHEKMSLRETSRKRV